MERRTPPDREAPRPRAVLPGVRARCLLIALAGMIAACGPPKFERERQISDAGPPPVILPLDAVLAQTDLPGLEPTDTTALQSRAAGLQARGAALAATEADPETRARLDAALEARGP